jgi:hypothetical protein
MRITHADKNKKKFCQNSGKSDLGKSLGGFGAGPLFLVDCDKSFVDGFAQELLAFLFGAHLNRWSHLGRDGQEQRAHCGHGFAYPELTVSIEMILAQSDLMFQLQATADSRKLAHFQLIFNRGVALGSGPFSRFNHPFPPGWILYFPYAVGAPARCTTGYGPAIYA